MLQSEQYRAGNTCIKRPATGRKLEAWDGPSCEHRSSVTELYSPSFTQETLPQRSSYNFDRRRINVIITVKYRPYFSPNAWQFMANGFFMILNLQMDRASPIWGTLRSDYLIKRMIFNDSRIRPSMPIYMYSHRNDK